MMPVKKTYKNTVATNLKISGSPVAQRDFKGEYTKEQVIKAVKKMKDELKGHDVTFMISTIVPEVGEFRSGKQFKQCDDIRFSDYYHFSTTSGFKVYVWNTPAKAGGDDGENNDCFYECIIKAYTSYRLPKDMKTPTAFKKKMNFGLSDKVHIKAIPRIEKQIDLRINVTGDHTYTSGYKLDKFNIPTVNLVLIDGHYTLIKNIVK
jgi:hypothetical protein